MPAGTVRPGEDLEHAVLREAWEETGLSGLTLAGFLGERQWDMRDVDRPEIHHRSYFHLVCDGDVPESWLHLELDPADGGPPVRFEFFWVSFPDGVPTLHADHDAMLPELITRLRERSGATE